MDVWDRVWELHCMGLAPSQVAAALRKEHPQLDADACRRVVADHWLDDKMAHQAVTA